MKATTELNKARANKLHSDAINRMIVNHEDELDGLHDEVERYKRIALNLVATIVLLVIIGGYAIYYEHTKCKGSDKVEMIDLRAPDKGNAYVLRKGK
jgi:hypothetical protein